MTVALLVAAVVLALVVVVVVLVRVGQRPETRALVTLAPDCLVLFRRLATDPSTPRRSKLVLVASIAYLAMPVDLVPDFIPILGQLDDAIIVALSLRAVLRASDPTRVREHWPGPPSTLSALLRLAGRADPCSRMVG
jgi:uncharacterized membrane protein YkvA (DUF1232 family)